MLGIPNIQYTLQNDICTGCGICTAACPKGAITMITARGRFIPTIDGALCVNSKGCHRCYDTCPGVGVNLIQMSNTLFQSNNIKTDYHCGKYLNCYTGNSCDNEIRFHSASGGATTQFLIWLLRKKIIDGALVTKFDANCSFKVKSFIATSYEDLNQAKGSKYAPVSLHEALKSLKLANGGKYVVVGLPCHIEGMRKLVKLDKDLNSKVMGFFSVFCSSSRTFYMTEYLMNAYNINIDRIRYLAYRDNGCLGGMVVKGDGIDFYKDYQQYSHPLRSIFVPRRCLLCADHYGELADISFGDIHISPFSEDKIGINSIVVRSAYWDSQLINAASDGVISLNSIDIRVINQSQPSAKMKKGRNLRFIKLLKHRGHEVPVYDLEAESYGLFDIINYMQNRLQQFIGDRKKLWFLIPLIKDRKQYD